VSSFPASASRRRWWPLALQPVHHAIITIRNSTALGGIGRYLDADSTGYNQR
jgi:hypothetical protein